MWAIANSGPEELDLLLARPWQLSQPADQLVRGEVAVAEEHAVAVLPHEPQAVTMPGLRQAVRTPRDRVAAGLERVLNVGQGGGRDVEIPPRGERVLDRALDQEINEHGSWRSAQDPPQFVRNFAHRWRLCLERRRPDAPGANDDTGRRDADSRHADENMAPGAVDLGGGECAADGDGFVCRQHTASPSNRRGPNTSTSLRCISSGIGSITGRSL